MASTEDDVSKNQSALTEKLEQEERELPTSSGTGIGKLFQVENKVQAVTEEPDETVKTNSQVEIANESIAADNLEHIDGEQFSKSPLINEIAGEKSSSSAQVQNGKDLANEADKEKPKTNLTAEGGSENEEADIQGANVPGTQLNAEESRDLSTHEAICVVQEDNIMNSQEATAEKATEIENHLDDAAQDMIAKSSVTSNHDAYQQNTSNTLLTASFQDLHEVDLKIKKETDLATTSSSLDSKEIEPQGLSSSQNVKDETTEDVQKSLAHTRNFPSGRVCKSDQTEMGKEVSQDTEALVPTDQLEDEPTEKIELFKEVSTEAEYKGSTYSETTEEVECLSQHAENVSTEADCAKEHKETIEGNPQDAERVMQSTKIDNATTKKVEISPDLAESVSTGVESGPDNCEMAEGNFEDQTTLLHSAILEEETTGKVESLSGHTIIVSEGTGCCSDPSKGLKENTQDAEKLSHPVNVQDENTEKAGNLPDSATNVSADIEDRSNYIAATKEETSDDVEMNTLGAEPGEISSEVKSTDDGKEKEILELETSEIGSTTDAVSSTSNYSNKSVKEDVENSSYEEQVSSPMITTLTTEVLLKDVGPENVPENKIHSGNIFDKEESEKEDTSCTEPAPVKELSDMVPLATKENQDETENQNMFREDVGTDNSNETVMSKAKEMPESSSNDLVMEERETLEKESQEQVHVEPLAGEHVHDEVSKGLTEINIEVEEPVKPEISNTEKDLEALLPKNEPKKETLDEFLQEASGPLQKIDSSQHFDRTNCAQMQISTELLEGDLCEEKDCTSSASKSKEDNSITNTMVDGSSKEIDYAFPNDTAQETYETEGNDSEEGAPQPKEDQVTAAEGVYEDFCKDEEKEMEIINKDEVTKEYLTEVSAEDENKLDHEVKTEAMNYEADDIHEREAVYRNDAEDIKESESVEGALELKDQISAEQVDKDTSEKDDKKEISVIDADEVDTALVESSPKEEKLSNHEVTTEITNTKGDEFHQEKVDQLNHNKETEVSSEEEPEQKAYQIAAEKITNAKGDEFHQEKVDQLNHNKETEGSSEEVPEPKAYQIAAEEITNTKGNEFHQEKVDQLNHNKEAEGSSEAPEQKAYQIAAEEDTIFNKDEEETKQIIDEQEMAAKYLTESSIIEENKLHYKLETEPINPEADDIHKQEAFFSNDDEKMKGHIEEKAENIKQDQIMETEEHMDILSRDLKNGPQILDKEVAATITLAEDENFDLEVKNPEADEFHEGNEEIKVNDSGVTKSKDQIAAETHRDMFTQEEKEMQMMNKEVTTENPLKSSVVEEQEFGHKVIEEETIFDSDELQKAKADHIKDDKDPKGSDSEEEVAEPNNHIAAEKIDKETFSMDEVNEAQIIDKETVATEHLEEENKSRHEAMEPEADDVNKEEAVHKNGDEGEPVLRKNQILDEEECQDTFSKDQNKDTNTEAKELEAIEYLEEHYVVNENKSYHEIKTKATNQGGDDDEEIIGNDPDEIAAELKVDHIAEEKVMQASNDKIGDDAEKETQIIEGQDVATEYSVDPCVADFNKSDDKVITEKQ